MKKMMMFVSLIALAAFIWGGCGGSATSDAELEEALNDLAAELEKDLEAETGGEAEGGAASGDPCDAYAKCCEDYITALEGLDGYPAASVDAMRDGCKQVEQWKGVDGMDTACQGALDGMKTGAEAMAAMPGWTTPDSCK